MATPQLSPGILVREVDLTVGRADNVLQNNGAIAGPFSLGPVSEAVDITTEEELIEVFGQPISTDRHYEYWMTASSFLSYGGRLKVVRVDGSNLNNANAAVGIASTTLKIKNFDDYNANYSSATDFYYAGKNPGTYLSGLKVATIDDFGDQVIGINTTDLGNLGATIGFGVTSVLSGTEAGVGTTRTIDGHLKAIITGVTTDSTNGNSSIVVKITSRVSGAGTESPLTYVQSDPNKSFESTDTLYFVNNSGINTGSTGTAGTVNVGRKAVEAAGFKTTYVEGVPESADAERVLRQLANSGHDIIFTTSFGYMNPTNKVAKEFPNVKFEHATGYKREHPNVSTYAARFYEGRTILGTIAGTMTKSNVIGYVASFPIPEVIRGINSFTLAAQKVNPNIKTKIVWAFTWYDPGKEAEAAKALIDQGADVIAQHTDSTAIVQMAEKAGVYAFGQASDMDKFAPKAVLTSVENNWGPYYVDRVKAVANGTWNQKDTWHGIGDGMVVISDLDSQMPADLRSKVKKLQADLASGKVHSFTGPIYDQKGNLMVAEGKTADDGMLAGMMTYVKGVEGDIPK